ncbi:hypothetical protein GGI25_004643 [Coemansia spiralis]|uniref:Translocation protein sec72 n=2 Tax=Coemansia TaxID=4863 RepID=A0A9W8G431_9FUNG|nr:hypothetical protein BX070DRAFT_188090 [Coemansia spiralis]KAJ1985818.1 hypothetical protein EDC05_006497 [Coemansia umbellata]KAJ2620594.1 hypothetical protein GGI26_004883 [Coemansia sp. RSA 1358]KAJ2673588.1 hypothetical protein GGI25_004643 [Coemansia spiralis]
MATPFGPRPVFPTSDKPSFDLSNNTTLIDGLLHCTLHKKQVCSDCSVDYSTHNFLSRQLAANNQALPPPNPQMAQTIQKLKTEGNDLFRAQNYFDAAQKYTEALNVAMQRPLWDPSATVIEETSVLMSNRAACLLELGKDSEAYWDTEVVTRLKRGWSKGHFRMGRALLGLGRCGQAAAEFQIGASLDPSAKEIKTALEQCSKLV